MIKGAKYIKSMLPYLMIQQELTSQNLANAGTNGYKADRIFIKQLNEAMDRQAGEGKNIEVEAVVTIDHRQGELAETRNPLDLAIQGEGYFEILTRGGARYTRNGAFSINPAGELCTMNGDAVAGAGGVIQIKGRDLAVDQSGVVFVDGAQVGRIKIVVVPDRENLVKEGESLLRLSGGDPTAARDGECTVLQGFLERSNVNPLAEMVNMMSTFRRYESGMKAIQIQSQTVQKAINEVGRTG